MVMGSLAAVSALMPPAPTYATGFSSPASSASVTPLELFDDQAARSLHSQMNWSTPEEGPVPSTRISCLTGEVSTTGLQTCGWQQAWRKRSRGSNSCFSSRAVSRRLATSSVPAPAHSRAGNKPRARAAHSWPGNGTNQINPDAVLTMQAEIV